MAPNETPHALTGGRETLKSTMMAHAMRYVRASRVTEQIGDAHRGQFVLAELTIENRQRGQSESHIIQSNLSDM